MHDIEALTREHLRLRWMIADLKLCLVMRELARKAGFNPDQPRVPAGNPDGGQWTREDSRWTREGGGSQMREGDGSEAAEPRVIQAQLTQAPSPYIEDFVMQGGRNLGRFNGGVSVAVSAGVQDQESFDPQTGVTTLSLSGIGYALVDEELAGRVTPHVVGDRNNPDRGLSIRIDRSGGVSVSPTRGS